MSQKIQKIADETGKEISTSEIWEIFHTNFVMPKSGHSFKNYSNKNYNFTDVSDHIKAEWKLMVKTMKYLVQVMVQLMHL